MLRQMVRAFGLGGKVNSGNRARHAMLEGLESRMLLTGTFSLPEIAGDWTIAGGDVNGDIVLAGGTVTGGTVNFDDGSTVAGNGTYTLDALGNFELTTNEFVRSGSVSSTRDVFSITNQTGDFPVTVGVLPSGAYTINDAVGTWDFFTNAETTDGTASGSLTLDALGNATGKFKSTLGTTNITGTYTVDASGEISFALTVKGLPVEMTGAINASKDVIAAGADDLEAAALDGAPRLMVLEKRAGKYVKGDLIGDWTMAVVNGSGTVTFDGNGKLSGELSFDSGPVPVTGTYSITPAGLVTMRNKLVIGGDTFNYTLTAALNANKNFITGVQTPTVNGALQSNNSLQTFTRSEDAAPTVSKLTLVPTIVADVGKDFTPAQLFAAMDEGDIDLGDEIKIETVGGQNAGIFVNGIQKFAPTVLQPNDILTVVPSPQTAGKMLKNAVEIKVFDGSKESVKTVNLAVKSVAKPVVSIAKSGNPNELTDATGKFTISRAGGDLKSDLVVNYTVTGTAANGTNYDLISSPVTIPAGKPNVVIVINPISDGEGGAAKTVTLTLDADAAYTVSTVVSKQSATLTITDPNRAPTINNWSSPVAGTINNDVPLNFALLIGRTLANDPEGNLSFKIKGIKGTLKINGVAVVGSTAIVEVGDTMTWTPPVGASGTVKMFDLAAFDGSLTSVYKSATALLS
jgi:hypothetical protein